MSFIRNLAGVTGNTGPAPSLDTRMVPQLLAVCCVCGLIRDELRPAPDPVRWTTQRMYQRAYGVNSTECPLTHTYCPDCLSQAQKAARMYFRKIGV
jgi:hypothetical protein